MAGFIDALDMRRRVKSPVVVRKQKVVTLRINEDEHDRLKQSVNAWNARFAGTAHANLSINDFVLVSVRRGCDEVLGPLPEAKG